MTSINTNISAYYAQNNLRAAGAMAQSSIAKLSSGQRIIKASDDVAALSIGTILRTNVSTLKTALVNTNQGSTVLQVADGALARLGEILQRQKSLAVQANSGTLSNTERGYLQQEFKALTDEYDRIVNNTNFNNVKLLDGSLASAETDPETPAEEVPFAATNDMSGNTYFTAMDNFDDNDLDAPGFAGDWSSATVAANLLNAGNDETFEIVITIGSVTYTSSALDSANGAGAMDDIVFTGDDGSSFQMDFGTVFDNAEYDTNGITGLDALVEAEVQAITMEGPGIEAPAEPVAYEITGDLSGGTYVLTNPELDATGLTDPDTDAGFIGSWADIDVQANLLNAGNDETFELVLTLNGVTYTSTALDSANGAGAMDDIVFTGDDGSTITLDFGSVFDNGEYDTNGFGTLADDIKAELAALSVAAPEAPAEEEATGPLSFQVGSTSSDSITIAIKSLKSADVYLDADGETVALNIGTAAGAITASDVLDRAIKTLISTRADVGALQSRFGYAASALEVSIQNIDAARAQFLDADISEESTNFAKAQVLQQAAISVLAQANQIPQNLLKLIG